jgi:phenylalanyl-tRNA synthetase beta chain
MKGYLTTIFERLGIKDTFSSAVTDDVFSEGIAINKGNSILAEFGVVKKSILKHFDIKQEVLYANIRWEAVIKLVSDKIKFTEIAKYPEVNRDLALLLDESVNFENVYQTIKQTEKKLIKAIDLFDVYQGDKLPEGKKSYAISLVLQDSEKTLTDSQIEKTMSKIISELTDKLGAVLRN